MKLLEKNVLLLTDITEAKNLVSVRAGRSHYLVLKKYSGLI